MDVIRTKESSALLKTILMLNNDKTSIELVKTHYQGTCTKLIHVHKTTEAWNELCKKRPDCILIDIPAATQDGYSFTRKVRKDAQFQHIPIIFLAEKGFAADRIDGYNAGCDVYITKAFNPQEVHSAVLNLITRRHSLIECLSETYYLLTKLKKSIIEKNKTLLHSQLRLYLTKQEIAVLENILSGKTHQEISTELKTSLRNIEKYATKILNKTLTKNVNELRELPWDIITVVE
jgi:DNA-binding NarL/FixJ family response regulator